MGVGGGGGGAGSFQLGAALSRVRSGLPGEGFLSLDHVAHRLSLQEQRRVHYGLKSPFQPYTFEVRERARTE